MADKFDLALEMALGHLGTTYDVLRGICQLLPIPVLLPASEDTEKIVDLVEAVSRLADLTASEPLPEEQQALLFNAAIMWIATVDLVNVAVVFRDRGDSALLRLMAATATVFDADDSLIDLHDWLQANQ